MPRWFYLSAKRVHKGTVPLADAVTCTEHVAVQFMSVLLRKTGPTYVLATARIYIARFLYDLHDQRKSMKEQSAAILMQPH